MQHVSLGRIDASNLHTANKAKHMQLANLAIDRIIIHQVYQRDLEGNKRPPFQSHELTRFDDNAMETFKARIRDALGERSKAVPMQIFDQGSHSAACLVDKLISQNDDDFAASSYDFAIKLTNTQQSRSIPGGILVIFTGSHGHPARKFLGLIKAEVHSGYEKQTNEETKEISLKFVEEVLLTPSTRLYKTAGFFQKPEYDPDNEDQNANWGVMISDYQIDRADGKAAAQYFYSDFLGCGYPETSARVTKRFYDASVAFIQQLDASDERKNDLFNALTTYLKVDVSTTASASDFASRHFEPDDQDAFTQFMQEAEVPINAFAKDIEYIETKLKYRKVSFNRDIKLVGPAQAFRECVAIESINGDLDESGTPQEWTRITVRDSIKRQE